MKQKNPRGRPPLDRTDRSVTVTFRLPGKQYDATLADAARERQSLGDYIRRKVLAPRSDFRFPK